MITATYFDALEPEKIDLTAWNSESGFKKDIFGNELNQSNILRSVPIENYAAFFGDGIPLMDNSLILANEDFYFGFISNNQSFWLDLTIENEETASGLTLIFDRCSCSKIDICLNETVTPSYSFENPEKPLIWYLPFEIDKGIRTIEIRLSGFEQLTTLKGVVVGKNIDFLNYFEFNYLNEIKPLGDDLPINQIESSVYLEDDFYLEENQRLTYYDGSNVLEETFLINSEFEKKNRCTLTSQNIISQVAEDTFIFPPYYIDTTSESWNNVEIFAKNVIDNLHVKSRFKPNYIFPEWFSTYKLSPFLKPSNGRKVLQQIAWCCCCGIKTDEKSNTIEFVPFLATESVVPNVVINIEDNRILKSKVAKGENYCKLVLENTVYTENPTVEILSELSLEKGGFDNQWNWEIESSNPIRITDLKYSSGTSAGVWITFSSPFKFVGGFSHSDSNVKVWAQGYKYESQKRQFAIDLPNKSNKTLTISNQELYPIDPTLKIAQLKKWYTKNNTLSATLVDYGDLNVGKILKLELENGGFFTGIITSVERSNISDYHTVNVEVHEWD